MKPVIIAALALALALPGALAAVAQTPANPGTGTMGTTAGVGVGSAAPIPDGPAPGANSFTEGQARTRLEDAGYAPVTDLRRDEQGIWRGMGVKDGKPAAVALDFRGAVTGQ